MTAARDEILARVRRALDRDGAGGQTPPQVPRGYRDASPPAETAVDVVDLFAERVEDYRATVHRCTSAEVEQVLAGLVDGPTVVDAGFPWSVPEPVADDGLTHEQLDAVSAVVTTATLGIATTGTLVLSHAPGAQGRRALTLVPDHHVCVLMESQVVPGVVDAVAALDPARPQTWISGPSATSDIELDRVEGVHGPRRLDVVLVAAATR